MNDFQWRYPSVDQTEFLARISFVEEILQKYGAEYIGDSWQTSEHIFKDGTFVCEEFQQRIWKRNDRYIRVDRIYFSKKPFLMLELSENQKGPYEDADPFPYDLPDAELEQEVRCALGIETP